MTTHQEREAARDPGLLERLGIVDVSTGIQVATDAASFLTDGGRAALLATGAMNATTIALGGLVARAQGLHSAARDAIEADNPFAAFTLLRAYAENAAALYYLRGKPESVRQFLNDPDDPSIKIGRLTNYVKTHAPGFGPIYDVLSQYAHPASRSLLASHEVTEGPEGSRLRWQSKPKFKSESDRLIACAWMYELAKVHGDLLEQYAETVAGSAGNNDEHCGSDGVHRSACLHPEDSRDQAG